MSFEWLVYIFVLVFVLLLYLILFTYYLLKKFDNVTEIKGRELMLICLTVFFSGLLSAFVIHKQKLLLYLEYTYCRLLYSVLQDVLATGLFAGFMTTARLGYLYYIIIVPRLVFDNYQDSFWFEHHQQRVGAITSFILGQLVMFASVYDRTLYQSLVQRDSIFLIFIVFLATQIVWVYLTIVRNWRFLYPRDKRKKVVRRIVLLQGEFMLNFFLQLALLPSNSYIGRTSKVRTLVTTYLRNTFVADQTKKLFLKASFFGWLIGHILFMIIYIKSFKLIMIITISVRNWITKNFLDQDKEK